MSTNCKWWRSTGSLNVQQIVHDRSRESRMLSVASLRSNNGWSTFSGTELVFTSQGKPLDMLPEGYGVKIHTVAAAKILRGMTVFSASEADAIYDDCKLYIDKNMQSVRQLDTKDPTLIAMRNFMFECTTLKDQAHSRKSMEKATQLAAHLEYLKGLILELENA